MKTSPNPTIEICLSPAQHRFRFKQLAPTVGHGEVSSKKIELGVRLVVTRPFGRHFDRLVVTLAVSRHLAACRRLTV